MIANLSIEPAASVAPEPDAILAPAWQPRGLADYQAEALERLPAWIVWLAARGEARGIERGDDWQGLAALDRLADDVAALAGLPADAGDDETDAAIAKVHEAIWDAKQGADYDRMHDGETLAQCKEVEQSDLRQLARVWSRVEDLRRAARDGQMTAARDHMMTEQHALALAADLFVFGDVPGFPRAEAE